MARSDVHSPANLVPEDYQFILAADNSPDGDRPGWVVQYGDFGLEVSRSLAATDVLGRGVHQCHHCGARIRYFAILKHTPSDTYIAVGETCLDRFDMTSAEFHKLRKSAELDRKEQRIRKAVAEFVAEHPDLAFMGIKKFESRKAQMPESSSSNSFIHDVANKLNTYGSLSERQVEAVRASLVRDFEFAARKAAEEAARAAAPPAGPVPAGKAVDIEGVVVGRKWHENDFGGAMKIVVELDNGSKIWFTEPSSVETDRGDRIACRLSTVVASDDDETFGFGKRPSRFKVLTSEAGVE